MSVCFQMIGQPQRPHHNLDKQATELKSANPHIALRMTPNGLQTGAATTFFRRRLLSLVDHHD